MPNISEISLHDTIYKLKDDNAVTQEQLEEALGNIDMSEVENHIANKNNPHEVTAEQVGALPLSGGQMNIDSSIGWESNDFFMEIGNPDTDSQQLAFSTMKMNDGIMHVTGINPNIIMTGRAGYEYQDLITITNEGITSTDVYEYGEIGLSRIIDDERNGEKLKLGAFELIHTTVKDSNNADIVAGSVGDAIISGVHEPLADDHAVNKKYVDEALASAQPDWNVNDETAPNYIKNRPFYTTDPVEVEILAEQSVEGSSYGEQIVKSLTFEAGKTYYVIFDGIRYECVAWAWSDSDDYVMLGNGSLKEIEGMGEDVPFLCRAYTTPDEVRLITPDEGIFTISIYTDQRVDLKIDEKYLPALVGKFTNNDEGAEIFNDYSSNTATGYYSHAEGSDTTASGNYSHAEGNDTTASGYYSHAEGNTTTASGYNSHAEGNYTTASGDISHAEGCETIAASPTQHVQGAYNIEDSKGKYLHIVGNGESSSSRSNAHTLDWDGNGWFAGDVYVGSTSGTDKDDGSKKLATEEYVEKALTNVGNTSVVIQNEEPTDTSVIWIDPDDDTQDQTLANVALSGSYKDLTDTPTALEIGALPIDGGTMNGNLTIQRANYPGLILKSTSVNSQVTVEADDGIMFIQNETIDADGNDFATLYLYPAETGIADVLRLGISLDRTRSEATVLHSANFSNHISADSIGATSKSYVDTALGSKEDKPNQVIRKGKETNITIENNTEYIWTDARYLVMTGGSGEAHGFITFDNGSTPPTISVTGFVSSAGDDINSATNGQTWEFSCYNGFIIWKNWSA